MTTTDLMDLETELPRRERRKLVTPVGIGAVAIAIAAAGFLGGVQVGKARGDGAASPFAGARQGAQRGGFGGAPPNAGATVGQVASVDGSTLYVDDASGTTIKVKLAQGGSVTRTAKAKAREIHPGDTVIVEGETAASGTVVASTIRATAAGAGAAAFGG
jgi:hypothetical protein